MFTLRCTQKLIGRGLPTAAGPEEPPTTLLGDWYANILVRRPQHLVLCVSERSLLPVLVPAKDLKSLAPRVAESACAMLTQLGVDPAAVETERKAMEAGRIGRTASRKVLGSLNDLMFQLGHGLAQRPDRPLTEHALWLAQTPCGPIEHASPEAATRALFMSATVVARARGHAP